MAQFLGFGNGADGEATLSGTQSPVDSTFSGSSGSTSGTAAALKTFATNDIVLIHQTRGSAAGQWELNQIASYNDVSGAVTLRFPLGATYTDSGADQAQIIQLKQYSKVTISGTFTAKAWDGDVGGILAFLCSGQVTISGTATATGKGYRGGISGPGSNQTGYQGEGTAGAGSQGNSAANGNGGGAGMNGGTDKGQSAAGGGHASAASQGPRHFEFGDDGVTRSDGGGTAGTSNLVTMCFGGGGGGGGHDSGGGSQSGDGGAGGGIVIIFGKYIDVTGAINCNGNGGEANADNHNGGGGGGAGGSIFLKGQTVNYGTNILTVAGGVGAWGCSMQHSNLATDGKEGRIRVEGCVISGSSTVTASESEGGFSFCGSAVQII